MDDGGICRVMASLQFVSHQWSLHHCRVAQGRLAGLLQDLQIGRKVLPLRPSPALWQQRLQILLGIRHAAVQRV